MLYPLSYAGSYCCADMGIDFSINGGAGGSRTRVQNASRCYGTLTSCDARCRPGSPVSPGCL